MRAHTPLNPDAKPFPFHTQPGGAYDRVKLRVLSNWGDEHDTCIYRFRVHGTPEAS